MKYMSMKDERDFIEALEKHSESDTQNFESITKAIQGIKETQDDMKGQMGTLIETQKEFNNLINGASFFWKALINTGVAATVGAAIVGFFKMIGFIK